RRGAGDHARGLSNAKGDRGRSGGHGQSLDALELRMSGSDAMRRSFAIACRRAGFSATNASVAAIMLSADATTNPAVHHPAGWVSTLAIGTRRAAVPLAV